MISTRAAALLGLTVPLSPIMVAVLGLWPEVETETLPDYRPPISGPDGPASHEGREEDELDRVRRETRELRLRAQRHLSMLLMAVSVAALEYE